jgi:membrane AbrB-like protein
MTVRMIDPSNPAAGGPLAVHSKAVQWFLLLAVSLLFSGCLLMAELPAASMIGPMLAAILAGSNGATLRVWRPAFAASQAFVGVVVAASLSVQIFSSLIAGWPLFLSAVLATVAASSFLGYLISRWKVLPGTTGVWGSAPGASTAMVLMADAFGADARLVAFMQYLRVILVTVGAALIARLWVDTSGVTVPATIWFPPI